MFEHKDITVQSFIENSLLNINGNPSKLYKYQEKILQKLDINDKTIILKSRQLGISSLCVLYAVFNAIVYKKYVAVLVFPNTGMLQFCKRNIELILKINKMMYKISSSNFILTNDSVIRFFTSTNIDKDAFRSWQTDFLYVDEYQFFPTVDNLINSSNRGYITYSDNIITDFSDVFAVKKTVIASTAGKKGTNFHKLWKENKDGIGEFYPIKLKWNVNPNRDQKWMEAQKISLGKKFFKSEFECKFVKSE